MYGLSRIGAHTGYRVGSAAESGKITVEVVTRAGGIARYCNGHERSTLEERHTAELPTSYKQVQSAVAV